MSTVTDKNPPGRTLFYVRTVHTQVELGTMGESVRRLTLQRLGADAWQRKARFLDDMWRSIAEVVDGLPLRYECVRVYQDGLPVCGKELKIVTDLAAAGSRNHQLLLRLREKGATIMGTESLELLMEEYDILKQFLAHGASSPATRLTAKQKTASGELLHKRDQFIAARINHTLGTGETGILFIGLLHAIERHLERDINVIYPVPDPLAARPSGGAASGK